MEDPVETCPTTHAACGSSQRLHLNVVRRGILGDLHEIAANGWCADCPHLVFLFDGNFVLAKSRDSFRNSRKRHGCSGCTDLVRCRVELRNNVSVDATVKNLATRLLHETALITLGLEDIEPRFADKIMPLNKGCGSLGKTVGTCRNQTVDTASNSSCTAATANQESSLIAFDDSLGDGSLAKPGHTLFEFCHQLLPILNLWS